MLIRVVGFAIDGKGAAYPASSDGVVIAEQDVRKAAYPNFRFVRPFPEIADSGDRIDSLFTVSPPTALILDRSNELIAAQLYLAQRGIFAPRDISLISDDYPTYEWSEPSVCSFQWKSQPWVSRVVRWVCNVANGMEDRRQSFSRAKFVEGGTIGPVPIRKK